MGNQQTAGGEQGTSGQSTRWKREEKVLLNVYEPKEGQQGFGFGVYHTGVEVYGIEYFFAGGEGETGSGVHTQAPRTSPHGSPWVYLKTVEIGTTTLSQREVNEVADRLGRENFLASTYHLLAKNCNHFSDAFCKAITKNKAGIPGWANRAANWGNAFFGPPASVTRPPQTEPREPPKKSVFETTKGYRLADGAPAATSSSARQKGSQQQRKNPWRDPNFFPGKKSDAAGAGAGVGGVPSS